MDYFVNGPVCLFYVCVHVPGDYLQGLGDTRALDSSEMYVLPCQIEDEIHLQNTIHLSEKQFTLNRPAIHKNLFLLITIIFYISTTYHPPTTVGYNK